MASFSAASRTQRQHFGQLLRGICKAFHSRVADATIPVTFLVGAMIADELPDARIFLLLIIIALLVRVPLLLLIILVGLLWDDILLRRAVLHRHVSVVAYWCLSASKLWSASWRRCLL